MEKRLGFILVVIALIIVILGATFFVVRQKKIAAIDSFEECAAAGYPIAKSYPAFCRTPDGRTFGQRVDQTEKLAEFTELKKGFSNAIVRKEQRVVRTTEEWGNLWNEMFPTEMITPVPLDEDMIIAIFMGSVGSAGRAIEIVKIVEKETYLEVHVKETVPGEGCVTAAVITEPYHIVQLKKSDKRVEYVFEREVRDC